MAADNSELVQELKDAYQARIKVMKGGGMLYRHAYEAIEALEAEVAELRAAKG